MTREEADFIGGMNMCDEISNEAYKKIRCHCEVQEPCEDAISRKSVLSKIKEVCFSKEWVQFRVDKGSNGQRDFLINYIEQLPSVTPQQKTGHWIGRFHGFPPEPTTVCSECGFDRDFYIRPIGFDELKFCPNCGAKMQESEG